jgi:hypothetical protein
MWQWKGGRGRAVPDFELILLLDQARLDCTQLRALLRNHECQQLILCKREILNSLHACGNKRAEQGVRTKARLCHCEVDQGCFCLHLRRIVRVRQLRVQVPANDKMTASLTTTHEHITVHTQTRKHKLSCTTYTTQHAHAHKHTHTQTYSRNCGENSTSLSPSFRNSLCP